jgi:3-oxoacyl-[acyl-carrier-protein] synthase-3
MTGFGLVSFGTALGDRVAVRGVVHDYTQDTERVLDYGYRYVYRCPPEVGLTDLAFEAGRAALEQGAIEPGELDLVVLAVTDITEYLYWDAAASLQARLGASQAEAVLVDQGCIGGITCLDLAAGRFATHPEYRTALLVGANRTCEAYWNRLDTNSLLFSDGASAAVADRDHPRLRWRSSEAMSDGRYSGFFRMEQGGAKHPFGADTPLRGEPIKARDGWDMMEFFGYDADRVAEFVFTMNNGMCTVVTRACERIGVKQADLARIVLLNDNARTMTELARMLGISLNRTNAEIAWDHGHFGAGDHLFCLRHYAEAGELEPGDLVALAGVGRGMHWASAVIEA